MGSFLCPSGSCMLSFPTKSGFSRFLEQFDIPLLVRPPLFLKLVSSLLLLLIAGVHEQEVIDKVSLSHIHPLWLLWEVCSLVSCKSWGKPFCFLPQSYPCGRRTEYAVQEGSVGRDLNAIEAVKVWILLLRGEGLGRAVTWKLFQENFGLWKEMTTT